MEAKRKKILEEESYYLFGLQHSGTKVAQTGTENQYQYNGKEYNSEIGMYDYGARFYQADIGRWGVIDPLAEKYMPMSAYNYVANNPLIFVDPDGKEIWINYEEAKTKKDGTVKTDKKGNIKYAQKSIQYNPGDKYEGNNEFVKNTFTALDYVQQNNTDENLQDGQNTVKRLSSDKEVRIEIVEGAKGKGSQYLKGVVTFDTEAAKKLYNKEGEYLGIQSAALELLHELGHTYQATYFNVKATTSNFFELEDSVTDKYETPAAIRLNAIGFNEAIRRGLYLETGQYSKQYGGGYFKPKCVICTE